MSLRDDLKKAWKALAYADQGELLSFEEKCQVLGIEPPEDFTRYVPHAHRGPQRQVALYVGLSLDDWLLEHAITMCERMDAGLLIVSQGSPISLNRLVRPRLPRIKETGITYKLISLDASDTRALHTCLYNHSRVLVLIARETDFPGKELRDEDPPPFRKLRFLDTIRLEYRRRRFSQRMEQACIHWIHRSSN